MSSKLSQVVKRQFSNQYPPNSNQTNSSRTKNIQNTLKNLSQNALKADYYDETQAEQEEEGIAEGEVPIQANQNAQKFNQNVDVDAKVEEILEKINLNVIPRQETVNLHQKTQLIPVIVQVQSLKSQIQHVKASIDLVCVVDVSGSMKGEKIHLVMDSLRYIQKILSSNDRMAIATFGTQSRINLPWTRNTPGNKEKIKKAILGMKIRDSTNIADGVKLGLRMIKNRKYKNPVTCMFVLTDGRDDKQGADDRVAQGLAQYEIKDTFVINSFGYGNDHDAKVMNNIANLKGGTFTFIENLSKASEHFILAMSGMLSVLAKNVTLQVFECPGYKISKMFGDDFLWKQVTQGKYEMNLNFLLDNDDKQFALLLELPSNEKINKLQDVVLKASLQGTLIELKTDFYKAFDLKLNFSLQEVQYEPKELVEVNYLRAKSGDVIGEAKELAKTKKYDQAQQLLNIMINEIEQSQFIQVKQLVIVLQDLQQVKEICKPQLFEEKGEALMLNKVKNHIQRQQSLNNSMEWNRDQKKQMKKFKEGKLQLSICDQADDYQNEAFFDLPVVQQFKSKIFQQFKRFKRFK